jgi:hypothetical protein
MIQRNKTVFTYLFFTKLTREPSNPIGFAHTVLNIYVGKFLIRFVGLFYFMTVYQAMVVFSNRVASVTCSQQAAFIMHMNKLLHVNLVS